MNKELKEIVSRDITELDLIKAYLSFNYDKYNSFTVNWILYNDTQNKLKELGLGVEIVKDYCNGDYTIIKFPG